MRTSRKEHSFDTVFVMTLMCAFIVIALLLVALGSGIYKNTLQKASDDYALRTSLSYVANKLNADAANEVGLAHENGVDALAVYERAGDEEYVTYIYWHDGALYEMYTIRGGDWLPELGTIIVELESFKLELENGMLTLTATAKDGLARCLYIHAHDLDAQGGRV